MDNTFNTQNVLSLCPGILGLERGIERAIRTIAADGDISLRGDKAINVVAYVEIEAFIIANLVGQMETGLLDPAPIWTNVKTFDAQPFRNKVHGIIGGYPCQPFSHAGERKGVDDERHLYPYISKQIEIIRPDWVYFENVGGHLSMGYDEVRRDLSNLGYRVEEGIYTAEEVGAPHRRERLFVFGVLENANNNGSDFSEDRESINKRKNRNESGEKIIFQSSRCCSARQDESMANTSSPRNKTRVSGQKQWQERSTGIANNCCDEYRFPAGQGTYQHTWEEPRTIESGMVYTIDGYNFTEDLHRAIGNSVVEQTAELAFLSLFEKHINNHKSSIKPAK